jgi:hypothetical protein
VCGSADLPNLVVDELAYLGAPAEAWQRMDFGRPQASIRLRMATPGVALFVWHILKSSWFRSQPNKQKSLISYSRTNAMLKNIRGNDIFTSDLSGPESPGIP